MVLRYLWVGGTIKDIDRARGCKLAQRLAVACRNTARLNAALVAFGTLEHQRKEE